MAFDKAKIIALRRVLGLSQREVAKRAGLHHNTINRLEKTGEADAETVHSVVGVLQTSYAAVWIPDDAPYHELTVATGASLAPTGGDWADGLSDFLNLPIGKLRHNISRLVEASRTADLVRERQLEKRYATPSNIARFVKDFYRDTANSSGLKNYGLSVAGATIETTLYTTADKLAINRPPLSIEAVESKLGVAPLRPLSSKTIEFAQSVAAKFKRQDRNIWSAPCYRLENWSSLENPIQFSQADFLQYRFSVGLLEEELLAELIAFQGNTPRLIRAKRTVPIRREFIPSLSALANVKERLCCGGIGGIVAFKREHDYLIHLQVRSDKVSDSRGLLSTLPKGLHQPHTGAREEINIHWTMLREVAEEIFGISETETRSKSLRTDAYLALRPGLQWLRENPSDWRCEVVSFGLNGLHGNYEFGILLVIENDKYYDEYADSMRLNWESEKPMEVSTTNSKDILRVLTQEQWASESVFHFVEALYRLHEIDPGRVKLPKIERRLT